MFKSMQHVMCSQHKQLHLQDFILYCDLKCPLKYLCVQEFSFVNTKQKRLLVISSAVSSPEHVSLQQQSQAHSLSPGMTGPMF